MSVIRDCMPVSGRGQETNPSILQISIHVLPCCGKGMSFWFDSSQNANTSGLDSLNELNSIFVSSSSMVGECYISVHSEPFIL